jgi:hypothetical protein
MTSEQPPPVEPEKADRNLTVADIILRLKLGEFFKFGAACLVAAAAVFSAGGFWSTIFIPPRQPVIEVAGPPQSYFGYYGDLQTDGTTKISEEKLELQFLANSSRVTATSAGDVTLGEKKIHRTWQYSGFTNGRQLVLSFVTVPTKEDPNPSGVGVYQLEQSSAGYSGTALYLDCALRAVVQCPYAMVPEDLDIQAAKKRWPKLFERACAPIELVPDHPMLAMSHSSCLSEKN